MTCWVCGEQGYPQSNLEPEEPCWCGEMIHHFTWEPIGERIRLVVLRLRYRTARLLFSIGGRLTRR